MLSPSLQSLLPEGVIVAELHGVGDPGALYPAEAVHLGKSVPKRAREFAAGRLCARRALAEVGIQDFPLTVGADRRAVWPDGIVGSITHTDGFCAAAIASQRRFASVGIDSEMAEAVKPHLWDSICRPEEVRWITGLPEAERRAAATLIFSAKEAFYKCQFPLTEQSLGFHDASVVVSPWGGRQGDFSLNVTRKLAIADHAALPLNGRYRFHGEFVTVAMSLPHPRAGQS